jgi:hypothetical protein
LDLTLDTLDRPGTSAGNFCSCQIKIELISDLLLYQAVFVADLDQAQLGEFMLLRINWYAIGV